MAGGISNQESEVFLLPFDPKVATHTRTCAPMPELPSHMNTMLRPGETLSGLTIHWGQSCGSTATVQPIDSV